MKLAFQRQNGVGPVVAVIIPCCISWAFQ